MTFFDQLETRSSDQRASDIAAALPKQIARAKALAGYADAFSDVDPASITGVDAFGWACPFCENRTLVTSRCQGIRWAGLAR